ncbi:MAG TPA: hypothetical protein VFL80_06535, partial [Thermoanaerobaculia bacterium]|nr:hypothetical protein [Thermoanaerobaculia bacterium]
VPVDPRFRSTLRIYSTSPQADQNVNVQFEGQSYNVRLQPGATMFEPAYGTFSNFPTTPPPGVPGPVTLRVVVTPPVGPIGPAPVPPFWAFISVTNNDTQQITTITPD